MAWYENGQKRFEEHYRYGKEDGVRTNWDENGQKRLEEIYYHGKLISVKSWNEDGSVKDYYTATK